MEQMRVGFEIALKSKLSQKTTSVQSEETTLMRNFRYFDIDADGYVSMSEWFKAIEKIGVIVPTLDNLKELFVYYDQDGDGKINYKEFSDMLYRNNSLIPRSQVRVDSNSPPREIEEEDPSKIEELLLDLRQKIAERGIRAIINLGKQFCVISLFKIRWWIKTILN